MAATSFSNALGQQGEDVINFKVVSNTTDFDNNNPSFFRVNLYKGVEFDRRFPWYVSALSGSIPFDRDPLVEHSIWYKRLQISSDKKYADGMYDHLFAFIYLNLGAYVSQNKWLNNS